MSYIDQSILPDEQILYRTKKHYIMFLPSALWTIGAIFLLLNSNPMVVKVSGLFAVIAAFYWIGAYLTYTVSEFAVTNKRILMREGFFLKHTNDTRLATISNVFVTQNPLGQILNYGVVVIKTYGGDEDPFRDIPLPFEFKKCLQIQLDKLVK